MTDHQQAAIDAAAISLRQIEPNLYQNPANPQRYYGGLAQDVLAAAEPHLRKKWAEEVRALSIGDPGNIEDCLRHEPEVCDLCRGREQAAKLLEGPGNE